MKHHSIVKNILAGIITLALTQPAFAVSDEEFHTLQEQFNQLADQVEENSKASSSDTTVGGYGELHYNNLSNSDNSKETKQLDLHRFVIFVNHEFNDDIRFFSEFEIEHALVKDTDDGSNDGEVEVEQAYVQFDLNDNTQANAGVFLIPVGIMNETHEPPAFYGVERNPVEKNIIPATWWEGGVMLSGHYDSGFSYDLALTSGLNNGTDIRGGRQKTSKASADNLAATARIKYTGVAGLELATTIQLQDDMTQDSSDNIDGATLVEAHARWNIADFTLTGLYGRWDIDGADALTDNEDIQDGGYIEASYKVSPEFGIFVRQNEWDNGGTGDSSKSQTDIGFNYWPHEDVVLKADYQAQNDAAGDLDGFNLGVGYQF
ncbi:MAG: porin [Gammaproteobacteria bacterium]|nr:porin [Gammaproteobacteria bacterium]